MQVSDRQPPAPPAPRPPTHSEVGVTRRELFNRSLTGMLALSLTGFGGAALAFLWPQLTTGFGTRIRVGGADDLVETMRSSRGPVYVPEGRFYLNPYPPAATDDEAYPPSVVAGMASGFVALFQTCPHLGCRVPWCPASQWFECPCHGSKFNRVGEQKRPPTPRGMDHFPVSVEDGVVIVDTGTLVPGAPIGTNTTGQEPEGPHCVELGSH